MNPDKFILENGEEIPLVFTTRRGLRNITLRPKTTPKREIHISIPRLAGIAGALKFAEQKRDWLEKIYARAPQKIKLQAGDVITLFGEEYVIGRRAESAECRYIIISGAPEFLERRLRDKIKEMFLARAREIIRETPREFHPARIAARDTSSRWGSCSSTGTISFSWRLAFAPASVMRYVIMHELAHKKHMDHSSAFWAQVAQLYGPGVGRAKLWLTKHGAELHRYF
ncbi:MAG: M48 family metallopeptidase [Rickettsiales bacterium]|jgi:predicted metal-dependent hydrolase|nr:M48 family metallopeptidase [Rickettsiales bacterium]